MKKKAVISILLLMGIFLCACGSEEKATEGLEFTSKGGSYHVTGYHGEAVNIVIPDTYNDVPVTVIAEDAFAESDIQTIKVGGNVEMIEGGAFYHASLLREVELPASLRDLGATAVTHGVFAGCVSLEKVTFEKGSNLEKIGDFAFYHCENLREIEIPNSVTYIGSASFFSCSSLMELTIPENAFVGIRAFDNCPARITYK